MNNQLTTWRIAKDNLIRRPFRTGALILLVTLFAFVLFSGSMLAKNMSTGIDSMSQRLGADILIVPSGYDKNMEGALLRGEPSTFYLDGSLTEKIEQIPGVAQASAQLFIASMDAECCSLPVQFIGYDPDTDFVIYPWLSKQLHEPLKKNEVMAGSFIISNKGDTLTFFNQPVQVMEKLDKTGMGFDTTLFMSMETARAMMQEAHKIKPFPEPPKENWISSVMIRVDKSSDINKVAYDIMKKYTKAYDIRVIISKDMMRDIAGKLQNISTLIYGLSGVFWLIAVGVLVIVFSMTLNERKREFALLRILGATRKKLSAIIINESLMISAIGASIGVILGAIIIFSFSTLISDYIGLPYLLPSWGFILFIMLASFILAALVGPLASFYSAIKIGRSDVYLTMRENE